MAVDKNGNDLEKLYKVVSEKFDIGDYDTFSSKMKTKEDREKFYNVVSEKGFDLGDYNEYENRLGKLNEVSQQGSGNTSQPSTEPSQPSQSTSYGGLGVQTLGETRFDLGVNDINFEVAPQLPAQVLGENGEILNVEIGQAEIVPTDKKTYLQSLENSLNNNLNQFKGIDERIQITGGTLAKKILGQTNTDALADFLGFDYNVAMDNAYQELDRLGSKMLETGNLTDGEIASGATDAVLSLVYTGLISGATSGVGLFTDMVGGSIADYNQTKADNLGISVEELYKQNKEDVIAPAIIGGLGFALERIGLKGVKSAMTRQLSSGLGRNLAVIGLDINKEGTTELVQYGLDGVNEHLANGGNMADVAEVFASRVASKEGLEQYLKGLVASGVIATPNIAVSTISNSKERQQALSLDTERRALIEQLNNEAVTSNPIAREAVLNKIESLTNDISVIVDKDFNDNKQDLPIEQVEQVSTLADMVTEIEQQIESENTPEEVKSALRDEQTRLQTAIDEIISSNSNTQNQEGEIVNETTQNDIELSMEGTNNTEQEITNNETETEILNDAVITDIESTQSPTELGQKESFARIVFNDSARTSRIQELESRLKVNNQNLGIAQDPMEQAKWMRDATEYAVLRIADGTIKTAKALGEVLGLSADDINLTKVFEDATKINNDLKKFEVPEVKQTVKSTIRENTEGKIQGKVTITNKQALTQRIRTLNEGSRLGKQNIESMRTEIKDMIKDLSDQKVFKGSINTTAVRQVANAVNRANTPKQVERALQVLDKVANDARFAQKVASMDLYKDRINAIAKSKGTPKDLSKVLREFGKVDIRDLDINDVDTYLNLAEGVYRRDRGVSQVSNVELQRIVDIANSNKEERQAEREAKRNTDEAKQAKVQSLRTRLSEVFGVEESTLNDIDNGSKPLDEVINDLQELVNSNKKTKEESVREVAKLYEAEIKANKAEILDNISNQAERDLVEPILDELNVDNVTKQSLPKYVTHLYNLLNNNSAVGLGDLAVEIIADKRVKDTELSKAVKESFVVPTKAMQWLGRNKFTSGSQLFDAVVRKREDIAEVHEFFGFTDVQINTNKALKQVEELNRDFNEIIKKYDKDLNFNPQGSLTLDIYSDVVQYRESWNAEQISNEFALRLESWQKSLDRMKAKATKNTNFAKENKDLIENLEKVLGKYVEVSEVDGKQVVTPKVSPSDIWNDLTEGHKEFYNFARDKYESLKDGLFAVSRVYGGLDVEADWVNYMPRMYSNIESTDALQTNRSLSTAGGRVDDIESLGNSFNSSVTKENTGSGKSRLISGNSLPINKIIRPNIINSFLGEASKIIYDSATMADRKLTSRMLDAERNGLQVEDEFPLEIYKSVVAQKILGDKYQLNTPELNPSATAKLFSKIGKLGTTIALGGATQFIKQTTPIVEVLGRVSNPTHLLSAMKYLDSDTVVDLMKGGDITVRAIEKELEVPKGSTPVSQQQLSQLRTMLRGVGLTTSKVTEALSNFSLKPLQITDSYIAKLGWLTFYIDYVSKNNGGVVDLTTVDKKAIAYANTQNSIVMNESDPSLGAQAMKKDWIRFITPFISFSVNSKVTLINSVTRLSRARTPKDIKRFAGEVSSNLANIVLFNQIGRGIRYGAITAGGYLLYAIISNVDLPDEEKEELLELVEKDKDNRLALNNMRSLGYLTQDFMFGGIFGKVLEPATQSITDKVIASNYGEDELIARGYYGSKKALEKHWLESTFSMLGTQGIYGNKFMEVAKLAGDAFESSEDYVKRKYQQVGADRSSMVIDSYYLDPNNIDKFDQQEYETATKATSLLFASASLLGLSDQWLNSTNRYGNTILNSVLREKEGLVSKRESEEMLRQAKTVNDIKVGDISVPLTYEKKLWYMKTYQDEYQSTVKEFPYKKDIPETEYNNIVKSIVEARMTDKFVRTNQDLFDKSISKLVRDIQKEAKELEDRYKYYGKK